MIIYIWATALQGHFTMMIKKLIFPNCMFTFQGVLVTKIIIIENNILKYRNWSSPTAGNLDLKQYFFSEAFMRLLLKFLMPQVMYF